MNEIKNRIHLLRKKMKEKGLDYFYITSSDYHGSEYVSDYFKVREYFSGFDGSNGDLLISLDKAGLWTDGRYFLQAEKQLAGSEISLFKMNEKDVPSVEEYLLSNIKKGEVLGVDGRCIDVCQGNRLESVCEEKGANLCYDLPNLTDDTWLSRPQLLFHDIWQLKDEYAGKTAKQKLADLRQNMITDYLFLSKLDSIMWLLNIRGGDVKCNPVCLSFVLIGKEKGWIFLNKNGLTEELTRYFTELGFEICRYMDIAEFLGSFSFSNQSVGVDRKHINYYLYKVLEGRCDLKDITCPVEQEKAIKNPIEQENIREIYLLDSVAVCRFIYWLQQKMSRGGHVTEVSAAKYLDSCRACIPGYLDISFDTICGYAEHAAIVHYEANDTTDSRLCRKGMVLIDSGGQYLQGTTDITRTIVLGEISDEEKEMYSLVAASMLELADAVFLQGCTGRNLDILARQRLWKKGKDYKHGTGHGIGFCLNVHEGPQNIRWKYIQGSPESVLEAGMVISNEPGYYKDHGFGIRIENAIMCRKYDENEYGKFLCFEMLTYVPIDKKGIDRNVLTQEDIIRINAYHQKVYEKIAPFLSECEREWLKNETSPINF